MEYYVVPTRTVNRTNAQANLAVGGCNYDSATDGAGCEYQSMESLSEFLATPVNAL
jgi:hypothetical protein